MNKHVPVAVIPREYESVAERELGESLERMLAPPWSLDYDRHPVMVPTIAEGMEYAPSFLIRNAATGRDLAIEVKSPISLPLPNVFKLTDIQEMFRQQGIDFVVVVHGDVDDTRRATARLAEFGVNALGVRRAADAAREIETKLLAQ